MRDPSLFKWRHFEAEIILCAVRWYLRDALSYRDIEELMRGYAVLLNRSRAESAIA
jgi:IS6 family transposase